MKPRALIVPAAMIAAVLTVPAMATQPHAPAIDYETFLKRQDMLWDRIPNRWEVAPYTGNGNVGFLFYQAKGEAKNVISIYAGRHDYYDHRLPYEGKEMLWIYRSRLPLGHFNLESKGAIESVNLRLGLWDAELTGEIRTSAGVYRIRGLSHSQHDILYFETKAADGESINITWHPDVPLPPVRATLDAGGGPKGPSWDAMREAPLPMPPEPTRSETDGMQFCFQPLHDHRGETTTGWEITGDAAGKQILTASIHHSFPEHNSLDTVKRNLLKARTLLADQTLFATHQQWWHDYYPQSFLTINDPEKEAFYWIQMYKLGSAMRAGGPILDLMGPWYHRTFWPMVWGDLNVQLIYWTHLTANRMSIGESLPNNLDKYADNLAKNVPERWKESAAIAACFPQDCIAYDHGKVPDMLAWVLHNYWLHCEYAGDRERMREGLFPLLKKNVNGYLNYIKERPVASEDGRIHIKQSWSPEYPGGHGQDINFTIALLRWACQTLLAINEEHNLNDPLAPQWRNIAENLVDFQIDENGLRIGKDIAFDLPHRHYSHLLAFYPLAVLTPETDEGKKLLRTSLDHWLDVSINREVKVGAMPVTGYTATGAASMYAMLGDAEKAAHYLDFFIQHKNVSPTTMYAEGNPVIESPLSFATCIHDMLLQSWGGKIRVFPAVPEKWPDVAFRDLRTQGAFLVSAKKKAGVTQFVTVESLAGSRCLIQTDIPSPRIYINGAAAKPGQVRQDDQGFYEIKLNAGETVTFTPIELENTDLRIEPIPVSEANRNLFGLSEKTSRLPGHAFYYRQVAEAAIISSLLPGPLCAEPQLASPSIDHEQRQRDVPGSPVKQAELSGGIIVALDFSDGTFLADQTVSGKFVVQGLLTTEVDVEKARSQIKQTGLYGKVSCDWYDGKELPYIDNLINVLLCESTTQVPEAELMRVIAPGGVLMVKNSGAWEKTAKPYPADMDQWNQFLHGADNNGVSLDDVGPPQRLRWHDVPEYGRSKALSPSVTSMVSAGGLMFTIEDRATTEDVNAPVEYYLVARDAFNGIQLWKRPMKQWDRWQTNSIKAIPTQQQRSLAVIDNHVYCCPRFGGAIAVYDAKTGAEVRVYKDTEKTTEFVIEDSTLYAIQGAPYRLQKDAEASNVELYALDLKTNAIGWRKPIGTEYTGGSLAVKGNRLVYHSERGLTCLDSTSGRLLWAEPIQAKTKPADNRRTGNTRGVGRKGSSDKRAAVVSSRFTFNIHPTIVITEEMVYCGVGTSIVAKRLDDGNTLWTAAGASNYMKSPDLFVANGLVWGRDLQGRDPKTGKVMRQLKQEATGPMSHDRCYRNRITHRYYLNSATGGTDFLKLDGNAENPNPWARSTCGLAVMPANGMIYNSPYVCQCAIGTMITGLNGLYNGTGNSDARFTIALEPRRIKGPAFGCQGGAVATASDWPTYRCSSMRGAVTSANAPEELAEKWKVRIGSHPTAPVVAADSVYIADRDSYTLHALDRINGETRWTFTAGGRIDSPPTYYQGLLLFGSRCGWVYCLRASDGQLVWKFNGMPTRRLICDSGRLESAWPVNGSIMVHQDTAYFAAGRSSFLDGGIGVFGLEPFSGRMKYGKIMQGPYQDDKRNFPIQASGTFQVEGFKSGIFSTAADVLFIRHQAFTSDLTPIDLDKVKTLHLMASPGFLHAAPQHRTYWTVDRNLSYGGSIGSFGSGPAGDTVAYDGKNFYEVRGYAPGRNLEGRGRGFNPLEMYSIFSGCLTGKSESGSQARRLAGIRVSGNWEKRWNVPTPFAGHAIAVSQNTLLAAGVPMLEGYSQEDTNASYAGKKGGIAWLLDKASGKKLQELRFDAAPTWDGIAIAHDHYFISLKDGSVVCLAGK